jgi:hypothetical protein
MQSATVKELKQELGSRSQNELVDLCLHLSKFKKENKELLTYLLYEASDEAGFIDGVKREIDKQFDNINTTSYYYIKKSVRKILRGVKKYIRYSKKKETEVELLIYFCTTLKEMRPPMEKSVALHNIYIRQIGLINKAISTLHEDLQYDYKSELSLLK